MTLVRRRILAQLTKPRNIHQPSTMPDFFQTCRRFDRRQSTIPWSHCSIKSLPIVPAASSPPFATERALRLLRLPPSLSNHLRHCDHTAESMPTDRATVMFEPMLSSKVRPMPSRITPRFIGKESYSEGAKPLPPASERLLVTATDTAHRLGTSPTCVSLMSSSEDVDVRTLRKDGCGTYSDLATPILDMPVWRGRISVGATIQEEASLRRRRETIDARVVIMSASANAPFDQSQVLQGRFSCERFEPATSIPLNPDTVKKDLCWGKILPARESDVPTLLKLRTFLSEVDQVAVPPVYRQHHSYYLMQQRLDIRIVTKSQALRMGCPLPSWVLDKSSDSPENELVCSWRPVEQDEGKEFVSPSVGLNEALFPSHVPGIRPQQALVASS